MNKNSELYEHAQDKHGSYLFYTEFFVKMQWFLGDWTTLLLIIFSKLINQFIPHYMFSKSSNKQNALKMQPHVQLQVKTLMLLLVS